MNKRKFIIAPLLLSLLTLFSCNQEDDIETIFVGKTWYMNGATINHQKLNSDIKNFYTDAGDAAYYITFAQTTFKGALSHDVPFSGTWKADGKHQTITLEFSQKPATDIVFDKELEHILLGITSYESGADFLKLKKDGDNMILLGDSRTKVYN